MINIEKIIKTFGRRNLFDHASLKINSKERIGLVGRNGDGKSTLLRILSGQEELDSGTITIPKTNCIGYVTQNIHFSKATIVEEGSESLPESEKNHHWKIEKILSGLGFSKTDMARNPNEFSGGFQVRLNLAKVLVSKPNLLLLDEPTNYLDISSIRWIKKFLVNWPNELILVTHDRGLMDEIVTHTVGIHRKKIMKIKGTTRHFYEYIAKNEETYERTRLNFEKKEKKILSFVQRFRAKARLAGMVQSRIKAISKTNKMNQLEKLKTLDFLFESKPYRSQNMLTVKGVSFSHPNKKTLFRNLNFSVKSNDRICIIGKNGKGKTTLLKVIAEILKPTTGKITCNSQVVKGVFEQTNIDSLSSSRTVEEEILCSHNNMSRNQARTICGTMMFEGDLALKKIKILSGGEKSRVMIGKLIATPTNLLLLDEPTNHLDIDSCDALLTAIDNFDGAVIMITHNEMFLHAIAERLIVFEKKKAIVFEGCYQDFLDKKGWEEEIESSKTQATTSHQPNKKEMRRIRSNVVRKRSKNIQPIKKNIDISKIIIKNNKSKLDQIHQDLILASETNDGNKIEYLSIKAHKHEKIIETQFAKLEQLKKEIESFERKFETSQ